MAVYFAEDVLSKCYHANILSQVISDAVQARLHTGRDTLSSMPFLLKGRPVIWGGGGGNREKKNRRPFSRKKNIRKGFRGKKK